MGASVDCSWLPYPPCPPSLSSRYLSTFLHLPLTHACKQPHKDTHTTARYMSLSTSPRFTGRTLHTETAAAVVLKFIGESVANPSRIPTVCLYGQAAGDSGNRRFNRCVRSRTAAGFPHTRGARFHTKKITRRNIDYIPLCCLEGNRGGGRQANVVNNSPNKQGTHRAHRQEDRRGAVLQIKYRRPHEQRRFRRMEVL